MAWLAWENLADSATVSASGASDLSTDNLQTLGLNQPWKSGVEDNTLTFTFAEADQAVHVVALLGHNLDANYSVDIRVKDGVTTVDSVTGVTPTAGNAYFLFDGSTADSVEIECNGTGTTADTEARIGRVWIATALNLAKGVAQSVGQDGILHEDTTRLQRSYSRGQGTIKDGSSQRVALWSFENLSKTHIWGTSASPMSVIDMLTYAGKTRDILILPDGETDQQSTPERAICGLIEGHSLINTTGPLHELSLTVRAI